MKNLFVFLFLCNFLLLCHAHGGGNYEHSDMLASMKPGDKAALLMVHFGTTHDDTRALTIDAINAKAQAAFPELKFQESLYVAHHHPPLERARHHEADSTGCHAETAQRRLHTPHRTEYQHH